MQAEEIVKKVKTQFVINERFFATILSNLGSVEDKTCKTMWTDGKSIGYNPQYITSLPEVKLLGLTLHELLHVTNRHHLRRNGRDSKEWNICCDYSINPVVLSLGYELPEGLLFDEAYIGKSPEEIFNIRRKKKQEKGDQKKQEKEEKGDQQEEGGDESNKEKSNQEDENSGDGDSEDSESIGGEGEGRKEEEAGLIGEVRDMKNEDGSLLSEADLTEAEVVTKIMIASAANISEKSAKGSSKALSKIIKDLKSAKQDWRAELMEYFQQYAKNDYTWSVPNRRYIHAGLYLPSIRNQEVGNVVLVLDSSGSTTHLNSVFLSEMRSLMETINMTVTVIICDDQVREVREDVSSDEIESVELKGFGSTDFRPPFKWLEEQGIDPNLLIYFTDLCCYSFPQEPEYPVIWASWGKDNAPFGRVIKIRDLPGRR